MKKVASVWIYDSWCHTRNTERKKDAVHVIKKPKSEKKFFNLEDSLPSLYSSVSLPTAPK